MSHLCPPSLCKEPKDCRSNGKQDNGGVLQAQLVAEEGHGHQLGEHVDDEPGGDEVAVRLRRDVVLQPVEQVTHHPVAGVDHGGQGEDEHEHDDPQPVVLIPLLEESLEAAEDQAEGVANHPSVTRDRLLLLPLVVSLPLLLREQLDTVLQKDQSVEEPGDRDG